MICPALETRRVLRDFADATRDADIAVVYYAGHGIEVEGSNYLIPVDAKLERDTDVYDEALSLDRVLVAVEPAKQLRLVILDACRDNPFGKTMKRTVVSRGIGRGLAQVEPTSPNTLIAYSAKAGFTAQDGDGANSPFTVALSKHLTTPGLDVRRAFGFVRDDVLKIDRQQAGAVRVRLARRRGRAAGAGQGGRGRSGGAGGEPAGGRYPPRLRARAPGRQQAGLGGLPRPASRRLLCEISPSFRSKRSVPSRPMRRPPRRRSRPRPNAIVLPPSARRRMRRPRPRPMRKPPSRRSSPRRRPRSRCSSRRPRPSSSASTSPPRRRGAAPASTASPAGTSVASLTPATTPVDLSRSVQTELGRVGCFSGQADGNWNTTSRRSLSQFNRYAGTKLDVKVASTDALDTVKSKPSRVCPLVCEHGFKADGDKCTKIVCREGYAINDDNECEKQRIAKPATAKPADRASATTAMSVPHGSAVRPVARRAAMVPPRALRLPRAPAAPRVAGRFSAIAAAAVRSTAAVISNIAAAAAPATTPMPRCCNSRDRAIDAVCPRALAGMTSSSRSRLPRCSPSAPATPCCR